MQIMEAVICFILKTRRNRIKKQPSNTIQLIAANEIEKKM